MTQVVVFLCCGLALVSPAASQAPAQGGAEPSQTREPSSSQAAIERASQLLQAGSANQSIGILRQILRQEPDNADAHLLLGAALALVPRESEAVRELQRGVELEPKSARAFYMLGTALARFVRLTEAREAFQKAIDLDPRFADAHVSLGLVQSQLKELDLAGEQFGEAIILLGATTPAAYPHYLLAGVFIEQHELHRAENELKTAIKLRPNYAKAYLSLGMVRKDLHDAAGALRAFDRAAALSPSDPMAQFQLGSALLGAGRAATAVKPLKQALTLRPDYRPALVQLCRALGRLGRTNEARACEQKAADMARTEAAANDQMLAAAKLNTEGVELEKQGKLSDALEKYRAAVNLNPSQTVFRRNLGLVLCRLRRWGEGIVQLREVLKQDPGDSAATQALYVALENAPAAMKGANAGDKVPRKPR
ncbi:MAG TPA: tetratricopeptide repeat protein [Terriglobia bacterium]|nr:tetratricopeptide repeat protein [Terriglobia bacterium]